MRKLIVTVAVAALFAAACSSGDRSKPWSPSTTKDTAASGSARTTDLTLDPNKDYGNKYANGILPVGDNKYVTDGSSTTAPSTTSTRRSSSRVT